jgi:dihydroorotase
MNKLPTAGSPARVLFKQGRVIDPGQGRDSVADLLVSAGRVVEIAPAITAEGAEVIDCRGRWVVPGLVDVHCHLRDPGFEHKETMATGTLAAARGGFTTLVAMANVNPVPDSLGAWEKIARIIGEKAVVRVIQAASVTRDLRGRDLCDMATLAAAGVRVFTDDGNYIERAAVLYQALRLASKLGVTIALHEEDTSMKLYWPTAYEPVNEAVAITRDLEILRVTGGRVHFQHLSTARSVELIRRAKREGLDVTAEVCPHHLTLTKEAVTLYGTFAKMAPPLRTGEDIAELLKGLEDGTIDLIATDHAPHAADDKNTTFDEAANGILGLETALPVLLTELVTARGYSPAWLIERLTAKPAAAFDLPAGSLAIGSPADVCVIDPEAKWRIDSSRFASKSRNTPYHGQEVRGRVELTFVAGKPVYDGRG